MVLQYWHGSTLYFFCKSACLKQQIGTYLLSRGDRDVSLHYKLSVIHAPTVTPISPKNSSSHMGVNANRPDQSMMAWEDVSKWFGENVGFILKKVEGMTLQEVEEIRLRINQPLMIRTSEKDAFLNQEGQLTGPGRAYRVQQEDLAWALEKMTHSSVYAAEEDLKQGFLTLPGGHRVGVTGEVILHQGQIQTLKHISALNLRIAREIPGRGLQVLPRLLDPDGMLYHTLLISPPRAGKTTLLRDLIRLMSNGIPEWGQKGQTVGVVDERGELAGMWQGVPTYNLGCRTDVLDGCPKASGMGMLVRSMAPQILAMDELGHTDDVEALLDALRTGVRILSTAHASSLAEAQKRPTLSHLLEQGVFERLVVLSRKYGPGTIDGVYDLTTGRIL